MLAGRCRRRSRQTGQWSHCGSAASASSPGVVLFLFVAPFPASLDVRNRRASPQSSTSPSWQHTCVRPGSPGGCLSTLGVTRGRHSCSYYQDTFTHRSDSPISMKALRIVSLCIGLSAGLLVHLSRAPAGLSSSDQRAATLISDVSSDVLDAPPSGVFIASRSAPGGCVARVQVKSPVTNFWPDRTSILRTGLLD